MRLCYIKREITAITELFLFNKKVEADNYILNRTKIDNDLYKILISEVDSNFLKIFEKMQAFDIRKKYKIEYKRYQIGDIEIQFGTIHKDILNQIYYFGITNYYVHRFEEVKDFCFEIMENFFPNIPKETILKSCRINEEIINKNKIYQSISSKDTMKYKDSPEKIEQKKNKTYHYHLELLQYIYYILSKN